MLPVTFGGPGRVSTVARDLAWYPAGIARAARGADILHCTTMRGPVRARPPVVVTVHDLALLRHPNAFPAWHRHTGHLTLRHGVHRADAVVAVSAFTRGEIVELLRIPEERIRVVPNGIEPVFCPVGPAASGDYVLAVGTLEPRKNLGAGRRGGSAGRRRASGRREPVAGVGWTCRAGPAGSPTRSSRPSTGERGASSSRRSTRVSDCRCWRRWPAEPRL